MKLSFSEFMVKIGFFKKEGSQIVQDYSCVGDRDWAMSEWEKYQKSCQPQKARR